MRLRSLINLVNVSLRTLRPGIILNVNPIHTEDDRLLMLFLISYAVIGHL